MPELDRPTARPGDSPHPEPTTSRARLAVLAGVALALAGGLYFGAVAGAGFPDGHLTTYERWMLPRAQAIVGGLGVVGLTFAGLVARRTASTRLSRSLVLALVVLTLAALALPVLGLHWSQLEHGQGG